MQKVTKDTTQQVIEIGKIILIGWAVYKIYDVASGISDGIEDAVTDNPLDAGTSQKDCGNPDRYSWSEFNYKVTADQLQSAIWQNSLFAATENDEGIRDALLTCWTDDDVAKLSCVYGTRGAKDAWSPKYNLAVSVENYLDQSYKDEVNAEYSKRGMTIYWI